MANKTPGKTHSGTSLKQAVLSFQQDFRSVMLASCDADGQPNASYAPYSCDADGNFFILVSELAEHTRNLLATRQVALLFIEDERDCSNLFARRRLSYQCRVSEPAAAHREQALDALQQRFGPIIKTLRGLGDFHLLELQPLSASYVEGFGAAWRWSGAFPAAGDTSLDPVQPAATD